MEGSNGKLGSNEKIRNLVLIIKKKKKRSLLVLLENFDIGNFCLENILENF